MHADFIRLVVLAFIQMYPHGHGWTYEHVRTLYKEKINSLKYNADIRPVFNQSKIMNVSVNFEIIAIVEVNDVLQSVTLNGFVKFNWTDEILAWDPKDYGGITRITPKVRDLWKPRMMLMNTLQERDPLGEDVAPMFLYWNGTVVWYPGGIFTVICSLEMTYFPFDEQKCSLYFYSMFHDATEIYFDSPENRLHHTHYVAGEWDLVEVVTNHAVERNSNGLYPSVYRSSSLFWNEDYSVLDSVVKQNNNNNNNNNRTRRASSFLISVLIPVGCLSLFNFLVYLIPVSSGEKISYGITVLLAQSVYMTTLADMLPRSSGSLPCVTIYVFCILIISAFNVIASVVVLFVYRFEKKQHGLIAPGRPRQAEEVSTDDQAEKWNLKTGLHQFKTRSVVEKDLIGSTGESKAEIKKAATIRWINRSSFTVAFFTWLGVNIWFFLTTYL